MKKYHKCRVATCKTTMSEGSPDFCPKHQAKTLQFKNNEWAEAKEEPYYPNQRQRLRCWLGYHSEPLNNSMIDCKFKCYICGKILTHKHL